ncbi:unnamed protein product [Cyclocybe aegerita]|uniref:RING-CH-type domain-containing protein n=1 Tax=Cyclocybe aegerita TaxID=1973307 RepID=A0A8S0WYR6_CYCAE|nr:unnamed protein product [Cyclocybe aegerita]
MSTTRVPTINDLRVKLCYICREEERADQPSDNPPRAWTHPCNCTLIAHEDCLLKWIQSSQSNPSRAPNALKCPQCGTQYEIESDEPVILRVLASGNQVLQRFGRYFTVFGAAAAVGIVGTSVYVCLTAYGAWAVEQFIGKEMFDLILTDDPINWTWSAYINLPLLPISLILSRFTSGTSSMVIPSLLVWPPAPPVGERSRRLFEYWSKPENSSRIRDGLLPKYYWPPPPILFGVVGVPIVRSIYRHCFGNLYYKLLGTPMPTQRRGARPGLRFNEGPLIIRIRAVDDEGHEIGQDEEDGHPADEAPAPPAQDGAAAGGQDANADPNAAAVQAAEQLIEINASSLGRRIGGALIIPAIASTMGTLLFRLSRRSSLLRAFLGLRGRKATGLLPLPPWGRLALFPEEKELNMPWKQLSVFQQTRVGLKILVSAFLGGSRTWVDSDPVWWRNAVGFGLFVVAKDCIHLLHLWLAKRELESRRVKDRDFAGVDIRELDLLPSFAELI